MNKTKIEWVVNPDGSQGFTWNPVVGCKHNCWYCYARKLNNRFKWIPNWNDPQYFPNRLIEPFKRKKPATIFVGSMCDLFGDWIQSGIINQVLRVVKACPQHTFQFLTKNSIRYSSFLFPKNCWLGFTVTNNEDLLEIGFIYSSDNKIFVSFEPLFGEIDSIPGDVDWIIIGTLSGPGSKKLQPKKEWIDKMVEQADESGIPIFMKNSLSEIWDRPLIQEFPTGRNRMCIGSGSRMNKRRL